jgi:flagellar motor switch protein FliM
VSPVNHDEIEALIGTGAAPAARVAQRDFGSPLRLGAERLSALSRRFELVMHRVSTQLSAELGQPLQVELGDVREIHADIVRQGLDGPLAAARFECAGQPGWIVWTAEAAVRAVETLLCGSSPKAAPRPLSELEVGLVLGALEGIVRELASAAGVQVDRFQAVTSLTTFGTWTDPGDRADPQRVAVELHLLLGREPTELHVYLPGLGASVAQAAVPAALPAHLQPVEVILCARLGEVEVPLSELLELEHGDVISLGTDEDGTLAVTLDGLELARARLGTSEGRLAVRLTKIHEPASPPAKHKGKQP